MQRLFKAFEAADKELFLVGGAVRDIALGIAEEELDDLDFCTNARPQESLKIIKDAGLPFYDMGIEFGTVGAVLRGPKSQGYPKDCQVTTYRSEEYYRRGSRHPEVKFGDTIEQDLGRRDFSINSMAIDGAGNFIDPYNGLDDLRQGLLRVVGDPWETLAEDPLRILRVARFKGRLGFRVDDDLKQASHDRADHIEDISRERWLQEMTKILRGAYFEQAMAFLADVRVLAIILPEVAAMRGDDGKAYPKLWNQTVEAVMQMPDDDGLRWAGMLHNIGRVGGDNIASKSATAAAGSDANEGAAAMFKAIAKRFKLDNATTRQVCFLLANQDRPWDYRSSWSDPDVRRWVRDVDPYLEALLRFARATVATAAPEDPAKAQARLEELTERIEALEAEQTLRARLPSGLGHALMEAFLLRPSPVIGELKEELEERIMDGKLASGHNAEYYVEALRQLPPDGLDVVGGDKDD